MADYLLDFADEITYSVLALPRNPLGAAINFFIYDSIKILLILFFMISLIGVLRTYIPQEKMRKSLSKKGILSYLFAAVFGAVTPFCSCSSIPLFIGFMESGVPLGAAFTFLVTSPLINEYLVGVMLIEFGLKITAAYITFGMILGISAGLAISRLNPEHHLVEDIKKIRSSGDCVNNENKIKSFRDRIRFGLNEATKITKKLWKWILVGVGVGAIIHGFIPQEFIDQTLNTTGVFSVPLAALVGVPIYANCASILPVAAALFDKGVPLGTALAFMMAASALSIPEAVMLRRVMKLPLIAAFFGLVASGIVVVGYLLNFLVTVLT